MNIRRLRALTIVLPLAFLLVVEALSLFVLVPVTGNHSVLRLLIVFAIITAGAAPFSYWVFSTIERQQSGLTERSVLLDAVKDYAIFMLDPGGRIATWNPGVERVLGYGESEIVGQHISRFYSEEDRAAGKPQTILQTAVDRGTYEDWGWRVRKDGTRFWANVVTFAVVDDAGTLIGFSQVSRDMSERREAEERIHALNRELEQRVEDLHLANEKIERRNRQLRAVNRAIALISGALNLDQVLQSIADTARELVQSRYAALGVADEAGRITDFITSGITPEQREAIGPLPQGHGLLGALIREGRPLRIATIRQHPESVGFPPNHPPMTSLLGVPIIFNERVVGDLYFTDKIGAEEFSEEDQDLVMLLASHAAVAIENAQLYEEVRASRDQLRTWNIELEEKVAERTREIQRYSKELTTRVIQAQEEERKRIARELHDDTAQSLSSLLISLDLLDPQVSRSDQLLRAGFDRLRTIAKRTLDAVRALSHDLRPTILDDFGLAAAIHWFADEFTTTFGIPVELEVEEAPEGSLTGELELTLFRVAQEALTNSGKYSGSSRVRVALSYADECATLIVADDGRGFDPEELGGPTRHGGLGLYGMRERIELVGGSLDIETEPGRGTHIIVHAPLTRREGGSGSRSAYEGAETC